MICEFWMNIIVSLSVAIIGSFVGFVLALCLERLRNKADTKKKTNKVLDAISEELSDICPDLNVSEGKLPVMINMPNWNALMQAGFILEILEFEAYSTIVSIYSDLFYITSMAEKISDDEIKTRVNDVKRKFKTLSLDDNFKNRLSKDIIEKCVIEVTDNEKETK